MAWVSGGEPVPLPLGTEVSAKYRGAFCEATIKNVRQDLICRVVFKHNDDEADVPAKLVRGTVEVGRTVTAFHPEDRQPHDAVIRKIRDQSQYTVEFDDGDIKTLKRNSMQMKGKRHYEEAETLDVNPLTDPENFSAPVSVDEDGMRRRRSTSSEKRTDSESGDEDDDESGDDDDDGDSGSRGKGEGQMATFLKSYNGFMEQKGAAVKKQPQLGNKSVDLFQLYAAVTSRGGMEQVSEKAQWTAVLGSLKLGASIANASSNVRSIYERYLADYERANFRPNGARPSPARRTASRQLSNGSAGLNNSQNGSTTGGTSGRRSATGKASPRKGKKDSGDSDSESDSDASSEDEGEFVEVRDHAELPEDLAENCRVTIRNPQDKRVYPAKILQRGTMPQASKHKYRYYIHYDGWNSRYDEWVPATCIMSYQVPLLPRAAGAAVSSPAVDAKDLKDAKESKAHARDDSEKEKEEKKEKGEKKERTTPGSGRGGRASLGESRNGGSLATAQADAEKDKKEEKEKAEKADAARETRKRKSTEPAFPNGRAKRRASGTHSDDEAHASADEAKVEEAVVVTESPKPPVRGERRRPAEEPQVLDPRRRLSGRRSVGGRAGDKGGDDEEGEKDKEKDTSEISVLSRQSNSLRRGARGAAAGATSSPAVEPLGSEAAAAAAVPEAVPLPPPAPPVPPAVSATDDAGKRKAQKRKRGRFAAAGSEEDDVKSGKRAAKADGDGDDVGGGVLSLRGADASDVKPVIDPRPACPETSAGGSADVEMKCEGDGAVKAEEAEESADGERKNNKRKREPAPSVVLDLPPFAANGDVTDLDYEMRLELLRKEYAKCRFELQRCAERSARKKGSGSSAKAESDGVPLADAEGPRDDQSVLSNSGSSVVQLREVPATS